MLLKTGTAGCREAALGCVAMRVSLQREGWEQEVLASLSAVAGALQVNAAGFHIVLLQCAARIEGTRILQV